MSRINKRSTRTPVWSGQK